MRLLLKMLLMLPVTIYGMDYYDVTKTCENGAAETCKLQLRDQSASDEELKGLVNKKYKIITKNGVYESDLVRDKESKEFFFTKKINKKDIPFMAISTEKKISNLEFPKWIKFPNKNLKGSDDALIAELMKMEDKFKEFFYANTPIVVSILGNVSVSENNEWRVINIGIWNKKSYDIFIEGQKKQDRAKIDRGSEGLKTAIALSYKNKILRILYGSREGGLGEITYLGSFSLDGQKVIMVRELDFYSDRDSFVYLYEFSEKGLGNKIDPNLKVGIFIDE